MNKEVTIILDTLYRLKRFELEMRNLGLNELADDIQAEADRVANIYRELIEDDAA